MKMLNLSSPCVFTFADALKRRESLRQNGKSVVLTNGCFDLLHTGHVYFLFEAARLGDALFIALNGDKSVKELKGPTRPIQSTQERAYLLDKLNFVHTVFSFDTPRLTTEIEALRPDLYAKAGDYTLETLNPQERAALEAAGTEIRFLPYLDGYSTTSLIAKINAAAQTF